MFFAFIIVVCLVAALGGALARKMKLTGTSEEIEFPGVSHFRDLVPGLATEGISVSSLNSLRRLGDGAAPTMWLVKKGYTDSGCTKQFLQTIEPVDSATLITTVAARLYPPRL